jgi:hypothetical protein
MNGLSLAIPMTARFQYAANSSVPRLSHGERVARSFEYPPEIKTRFLQLPRLSPRITDLALSITREAKTPYEQIMSVEQHLISNYRYSLDVGMEDGLNPLEDFLFRRKTGYCEHYATAMVIMLRTLGIPARLVTGFLPGEWNEFGGYYRVRQQDAHAWVEVFFPQSGWITFDPTPTVGADGPVPIWRTLGSLIDSVRLKWDRFVIQYSFRDQIAVAQTIRNWSESLRSSAAHLIEALHGWAAKGTARSIDTGRRFIGPVMAVSLLGLCLTLLGMRIYKMYRSTDVETVPTHVIVKMYARMLRFLASQGFKKAKTCTPLEFSKRIAVEWENGGHFVTPLTELYCRVRYGGKASFSYDIQRAEDLLNGLHAVSRSLERVQEKSK